MRSSKGNAGDFLISSPKARNNLVDRLTSALPKNRVDTSESWVLLIEPQPGVISLLGVFSDCGT